MLAEGVHKFLHWPKATAHGAGAPFSQIPLCPAWTVMLPEPVEGFIEFFHNVKAVQNVECFGKHCSSDLEVWLPHIRTNHLNLTTIIWPKVDEEVPQRAFLSVFDNSEKSFTSGVDLVDQRPS